MGKLKKVRLNFDLREEVRTLLEDLQERSRADSMTEVLRRALQAYDWLATCHERGASLYIKEPDGSRAVVSMPEFHLPKRKAPRPPDGENRG